MPSCSAALFLCSVPSQETGALWPGARTCQEAGRQWSTNHVELWLKSSRAGRSRRSAGLRRRLPERPSFSEELARQASLDLSAQPRARNWMFRGRGKLGEQVRRGKARIDVGNIAHNDCGSVVWSPASYPTPVRLPERRMGKPNAICVLKTRRSGESFPPHFSADANDPFHSCSLAHLRECTGSHDRVDDRCLLPRRVRPSQLVSHFPAGVGCVGLLGKRHAAGAIERVGSACPQSESRLIGPLGFPAPRGRSRCDHRPTS